MIHDLKESPSIYVITKNPSELLLKEVLAGIEEEGIPYKLIEDNQAEITAKEEVHENSIRSRLGIGVGIISSRIILHYNKLKMDEPIYDITLENTEKGKARNIGCNAARLYKQVPFKNLEDFKEDKEEQINEIKIDKIKEMVLEALKERVNY